jgi:transcription elongation factor Elf1
MFWTPLHAHLELKTDQYWTCPRCRAATLSPPELGQHIEKRIPVGHYNVPVYSAGIDRLRSVLPMEDVDGVLRRMKGDLEWLKRVFDVR